MGLPDLIQCHSVHLDGLWVLLLSSVDVPHVDSQPTAIVEHLVLHN